MRLIRRDMPRDSDLLGALFQGDPAGLVQLDRNMRVLRANAAALLSLPIAIGGRIQGDLPVQLEPTRLPGKTVTVQAIVGAGVEERSLALTLLPLAAGGALLRIEDRTEAFRLEQKLAQSQRPAGGRAACRRHRA